MPSVKISAFLDVTLSTNFTYFIGARDLLLCSSRIMTSPSIIPHDVSSSVTPQDVSSSITPQDVSSSITPQDVSPSITPLYMSSI